MTYNPPLLINRPNSMPEVSSPSLPHVHDLVSELLLGMRLSGVQYRRIQVTRPFGLSFGDAPGRAQFHFVGRGPVLLRDAAGMTMQLEAGDAVLLPRGSMHALVSDADAPCQAIDGFEAAKICETVASVGAATEPAAGDALIFSACMEFDLGGMQPLVGTMPEFMHVGTLLARYPEIRPMLLGACGLCGHPGAARRRGGRVYCAWLGRVRLWRCNGLGASVARTQAGSRDCRAAS